ncbi:MAG: hypothetical protein NZL99_04550 [Burkholderiaceae bacterium]|nr:hypothetical protein [Burkholderiaceae bacterium]MCX7902535.1 hypothetical protein [Burkholderiaceae bacterium]
MGIGPQLAGALTVVLLIGCGVFLYPWLLARRGGLPWVIALTVLLAVLFYFFDRPRAQPPVISLAFALLWTALPLVAGIAADRWRRRKQAR